MRITPLVGGGYVLEPYLKEEAQALDKFVEGLRERSRPTTGSSLGGSQAKHSSPSGQTHTKGCEAQ